MNFKSILSTFVLFLAISTFTMAQSPIGTWKTIDDNTGDAKSYIEITEDANGKLQGKIVKLLQKPEDTVCENCKGDKKGKKLIGMTILWDLEKYSDYWSYGQIMDPETGKVYKANVSLDGNDKLSVRGYIGIAALGRTQTWVKVK